MDGPKYNIKCKNIKKIIIFQKNNYFFEQKQSRNGSCLLQKIVIFADMYETFIGRIC